MVAFEDFFSVHNRQRQGQKQRQVLPAPKVTEVGKYRDSDGRGGNWIGSRWAEWWGSGPTDTV